MKSLVQDVDSAAYYGILSFYMDKSSSCNSQFGDKTFAIGSYCPAIVFVVVVFNITAF